MPPDRPSIAQAIVQATVQDGPDVLLAVRVQPRAARNQVRLTQDPPQITVRLTAPPVEGAANAACRTFLAELLDLAPARVMLIRGGSARHKLFRLRGVDVDQVRRRLLPTA
jgi:uncharacterized protein YggU (UPF0235/DUF167 family)